VLSGLKAASGANTIANGNNAQVWNWHLTSDPITGFTVGESAASINGAGTQYLFKVAALAGSTAAPLSVNIGSEQVLFVDSSGNVVAQGATSATAPGVFQLLGGNAAPGSNVVGGGISISVGFSDGTASGTDIDTYGGNAGSNAVAPGKGGDNLMWGGTGGNTAPGGRVVLQGGPAGTNSDGGGIQISGANASGTAKNGGGLNVSTGNATTSGQGGDFNITTGTSPSGTHGAIKIVNSPLYLATPALAAQTAASLYAGTGAPNNSNGNNGDIYFRSDGGALTTIYQKRAGAWAGIV
jgi:hypothetical protein